MHLLLANNSLYRTDKWKMVGKRGFEPPAPASRTQYSTRLSYFPIRLQFLTQQMR